MENLHLIPLVGADEETFIRELQTAFQAAVTEEFGPEAGEAIPRRAVEESLRAKKAEAFRVVEDGEVIGGVVVQIDLETRRNSLDLLYINPGCHSRGTGLKVWRLIEAKYPETEVWETHTPYFEKRNIHFYVNKCGFHIVEFFNPHHRSAHDTDEENPPGGEYFFRFEKRMKPAAFSE